MVVCSEVVVALVEVELSAVKFWRVEELVTSKVVEVAMPRVDLVTVKRSLVVL